MTEQSNQSMPEPSLDAPGFASKSLQAEDRLPPVEPPAAGFIMQLFVIPMMIVAIIVAVYLVFGWIARSGNDPQQLVADLERMNHSSWHQAYTLANLLGDPRSAGIRRNTVLAGRLSDILELHLNDGKLDDQHVQLRAYLCMAVGEFETDSTLPVLIRAANQQEHVKELEVRRAAVWAMGRIADHQGPEVLGENDSAMASLESAATAGADTTAPQELTEEFRAQSRLRSTAVVVLGKIGNDAAKAVLMERLVSDPHPDTRYNAAAQLAHLGDERSVPLLLEMLDPTNEKAVQYEATASAKDWKRQEVLVQAMEAAWALLQKNPTVDRDAVRDAVQTILAADFGGTVDTHATDLLRRIDSGAPAQKAA